MSLEKVFMLCAIFIFADIIIRYLKAWKFNKTNSSISRDGYIKKDWLGSSFTTRLFFSF